MIPHYDNAEGGTHDTRYCYLGERRLRLMEPDLPPDTAVLGVDEHTACLLDLDARTATVLGHGAVTVRRRGASTAFPTGSALSLDQLMAAGAAPAAPFARPTGEIPSLRGAAGRLGQAFDGALTDRDISAAVAAALELEQVLSDWAADTEAGDLELARAALRGMLVRLGEVAAAGVPDPREPLVPLVELRDEARAERSWRAADRLRDRLSAAGVELRDTPEGTDWRFRDGPAVPERRRER